MTDPRALLDDIERTLADDNEITVEQLHARGHYSTHPVAALRAVLDLHPSTHVEARDPDGEEREGDFCLTCDEPWPCPTVQAITTALETT